MTTPTHIPTPEEVIIENVLAVSLTRDQLDAIARRVVQIMAEQQRAPGKVLPMRRRPPESC